jgi:hypothetical protein
MEMELGIDWSSTWNIPMELAYEELWRKAQVRGKWSDWEGKVEWKCQLKCKESLETKLQAHESQYWSYIAGAWQIGHFFLAKYLSLNWKKSKKFIKILNISIIWQPKYLISK